jgi:hypothetical protein
MSVPNEPIPPPVPEPGWIPRPPVEEPDPDRLPDEIPVPNPDENNEPPKHACYATSSENGGSEKHPAFLAHQFL